MRHVVMLTIGKMAEATLTASAGAPVTSGRSLTRDYAAFVLITYALTWTLLIVGVKLGWSEDLLNLSGAGPAVAALLLSRSRMPLFRFSGMRWFWFLGLLPICWIVLSLRSSWWSASGGLPVHLKLFQLVPALAPAWILSSVASTNDGVRSVGRRLLHPPSRWTAFALVFFPVLLGVPSAIAAGFGARLVWPGLGGITLVAAATAAMSFFSNVLFAGIQEEPGWRGFLLDRLQTRFAPLTASLLVWLPWALWHAPVDYYRPVRFTLVQEILLRVVFLIPLTIILTWFYNRSGRSIQVVVLFHAAMNTFPSVFAYYQPAWFVVFVFAAYAVTADRMWSKIPIQSSVSEAAD
jgi:membrane protease YdiL (CAAX protease family)